MPKHPRPDETRAADIVALFAGDGLTLRYAEVPNGVDFVGLRGARTVALEVTRYTSPDRRRDPLVPEPIGPAPALGTQHSWLVFLAAPAPAEGMAGRLEPALQELERHRVGAYHSGQLHRWMSDLPSLHGALQVLASQGVVGAQVLQSRPPRLFIASAARGGDGDPPAALRSLELHLAEEGHHLRKTADAPAQERHLFIWLDCATPPECSAVFAAAGSPDLPQRPPSVPDRIDHLWVVHEQTCHGWHWQRPGEAARTSAPDGWTAIEAPFPQSDDYGMSDSR